jgi:cytochrome c
VARLILAPNPPAERNPANDGVQPDRSEAFMKATQVRAATFVATLALAAFGWATPAKAADADAAQALLKKSDCMKCHAIDKKKEGPPFKETAKKYKGKADAEDKLIKHVTTKPMIEIDGKKEEHKSIKSTDAAEVKNLVQWILSL